jgi:hypothetical protein
MPRFVALQKVENAPHTFSVCECLAERVDLADELAAVVREVYVSPGRLKEALTGALHDLGSVADVDALDRAVEQTLSAAIPQPGTHPVPHLDVARNELAEIIAFLAVPELYGTVIPASRIRHKEVPGQPVRGLDLLGVEDEPLTVVLGEVKASSSAQSPPSVVGDGDDSMRAQLRATVDDEQRLLAELNWALKHAPGEHRSLVARALLAHTCGHLQVAVAPTLVRPQGRGGEQDFGVFREDPDQFAPAHVRFSLLYVPGTLEDLANAVYERART